MRRGMCMHVCRCTTRTRVQQHGRAPLGREKQAWIIVRMIQWPVSHSCESSRLFLFFFFYSSPLMARIRTHCVHHPFMLRENRPYPRRPSTSRAHNNVFLLETNRSRNAVMRWRSHITCTKGNTLVNLPGRCRIKEYGSEIITDTWDWWYVHHAFALYYRNRDISIRYF